MLRPAAVPYADAAGVLLLLLALLLPLPVVAPAALLLSPLHTACTGHGAEYAHDRARVPVRRSFAGPE